MAVSDAQQNVPIESHSRVCIVSPPWSMRKTLGLFHGVPATKPTLFRRVHLRLSFSLPRRPPRLVLLESGRDYKVQYVCSSYRKSTARVLSASSSDSTCLSVLP